MNKLIIEAFAVGIILLIVSIPVMGSLHIIYPEDYAGCEHLPSKSKNKYYASTVIIGILVHLLCEFSGINKWYCKNGNACN
jgi:hypothetical protein